MALTKTQKNQLYDVLLNRMLRPSTASDSEIVSLTESVIGTGKDVSVERISDSIKVKVIDGKDTFEFGVMSEPVDTNISEDRQFLQD